jgi:gliding motility-associated-like protein
VQFEGDNLSGCSPLDVNFTNLSTTDNGSSYYWNFGDFIISAEQSPTHTFLSSRSYTIKHVVTTPGGCKDSLIKTSYITVLNSPVSDFTTSSGCLNTVINFTDKSTVLSNSIISWEWSFGDNSSSKLQNPTHIYTSNGSYTVTLKTTTNFGCSNTITKTIIINSKPIVQFDLTNSSGCMPLNVVFEDQSTTAVGSSYNWSFGDNTFSSIKNPTHVYISDGLFTVKQVVVAPGGCSDSLIKTNYVNVLSAITPNFIDSNRCSSSPTIFKQKCLISSGYITKWDWDFGNGNYSSLENPTSQFSKSGKFKVKLTATTNQGCSNSIVKEVVIDDKPIVNFKGNKFAGCVPENFIFSNLSVAPDSSRYVWFLGDSTTVIGENINHTYNYVDSFTVKCVVTSPQGCMDSLIKHKYISLKAAPKADFTFAENSKFYPDFSISFLNKSVNSSTYFWDFGDLTYSGLKETKHTYLDSGNYEICLTASSSEFCSSKVCNIVKIVSSKMLALPTAFSPNGDSNNDVFKLLGGPCKELDFRIFNQWGNLIFESNSQEEGWDGTFQGDILPMGTYNYSIIGKTVDEKEINLTGFFNLTR